MRFYGIVGPKNYSTAVTRAAAPGRPGSQNTGASPTPFATAPPGHVVPGSDYESYELRIDDQDGQEVAAYYLNADTGEGHWTFVLNFEKQINVIGGGNVRVRYYDRNCRQIKNCGPSGAPASRCATQANLCIVDVSGAIPAPAIAAAPQGLLQPHLIATRDAGNSGQWLLIDVVRVDSMQ
jgi:hypothetical protein